MTGFARFSRATRQNTGFARANRAALPDQSDVGDRHAARLCQPAQRRPTQARRGFAARRVRRSQDSSSFNRAPQEHL
jgi:hypothetical protein